MEPPDELENSISLLSRDCWRTETPLPGEVIVIVWERGRDRRETVASGMFSPSGARITVHPLGDLVIEDDHAVRLFRCGRWGEAPSDCPYRGGTAEARLPSGTEQPPPPDGAGDAGGGVGRPDHSRALTRKDPPDPPATKRPQRGVDGGGGATEIRGPTSSTRTGLGTGTGPTIRRRAHEREAGALPKPEAAASGKPPREVDTDSPAVPAATATAQLPPTANRTGQRPQPHRAKRHRPPAPGGTP